MNDGQKYLAAAALAAFACGGCATYQNPGYTTYATPIAVETAPTYIEPYYGGYYYEEPYYGGHHHHRHGSGPQHGYGMGPVMPPRGAGPARAPVKVPPAGRPTPGFVTPGQAHAAGKVMATQSHAAGKIMATQSHTAGKAAAMQMNAARNAAAAQSKAAAAQAHAARKAGAHMMPKRR